MNAENKSRIHPLVAGAAVALILASGVGIAAMTGMLPGSNAGKAEPQPQPQVAAAPAAPQAKARCAGCGTVVGVKAVEIKGEGSGVGAVAGGVAGGVLGHVVGEGSRNQGIATVGGAAAGAFAGHQIEKHTKTKKQWNVAVRMEDGSTRTVAYAEAPAWKAGDRVKVAGAKLERVN